MTAQGVTTQVERALDDPLLGPDPVQAACAYVASRAFTASPGGRVGLELELHLVDLADPERRPTWAEIRRLVAALPGMPAGSSVTVEPGGQVELSTPPGGDVVAAVADLRADRAVLRQALAESGYGAAPVGADLARPVQRVNPGARYAAMEEHFDALGCAGSGRAMMSGTAALQVNLDAGPATGWEQRLGLVRAMVPMLVALSATSPYLGGRSSGWHSMRQGTWQGIDHARSDPFPAGEPASAWASYALSAPVMLVREGSTMVPVRDRVSFGQWLRGDGPVARQAGVADLDYHLTTLFPPVRPRGYLEIRCIDALPDRWWPAVAAVTATLVDDPVAADVAAGLCAPVAGAWEAAARSGIAAPAVRRAVLGCLDVAAGRCPPALKIEVEELAELFGSGRTPSGELRRRIEADGPLRVLEEEARA